MTSLIGIELTGRSCRASVGETIPPAAGSSTVKPFDDDGPALKGSSGGGFAALMDEIDQAEEEQDFGGLMVSLFDLCSLTLLIEPPVHIKSVEREEG